MTSFYLAGKISKNGWRHEIVEGLRSVPYGWNQFPGEGYAQEWGFRHLKRSIFDLFDYAGPFFIGCDHGCTHEGTGHTWGNASSEMCSGGGIGLESIVYDCAICSTCGREVEYQSESHNMGCERCGLWGSNKLENGQKIYLKSTAADYVTEQCSVAILVCDIVFVWLDAPDAYGTLVEIGMAHTREKPIWLATPALNPEMWFAYNLAQKVEEWPTAKEALWNMTADLRKEEQEKNAIIAIEKKKQHVKLERAKMKPSLRYAIIERDGFRCKVCGRNSSDDIKLVVDHIFPVSRGGKTAVENLQTLCNECNNGKGARLPHFEHGETS